MKCRAFVFVALLALAVAGCGGGGSRQLPTGPGPIITPPVVDPPVTPVVPPTLTVTKIMAFGDSLTEGESLGQLLVPTTHDPGTAGVASSYPFKLQTTLTTTYTGQTIRVFNAGRGGEYAIGSAKDRLIQMMSTYQPEVVLLLHGVNNVNAAGDSLALIAEAVEEMVEIAHARGAHVILANLPPQNPTAKATGGARIQQFNAMLPAVAAEEGATFVDVYSGISTSTMLMPDGLHLNETGNVKLAELFYAALKNKYHRNPLQ